MTQSRITQLGREVLVEPVPGSRITQLGREVMVVTDARSRFTQIGREVMIPFAAPIDLGGFGGQLWPRGGEPFPGPAGGDLDGNYPDPTVVGLKGVPMVGTLGANQVWTKDPVNDELVPTTPGAPTSLYEKWDPFVPDVSPHSLTHEFDDTDLSAFTQVYIPDTGVTVDANTTAPGWLWMELPTVNYKYRALMLALPGDTNWTIHSAIATTDALADACWPGIFLTDNVTAGSGNQTGVGFNFSAVGPNRMSVTWAGWGLTAASAAGTNHNGTGNGICFLRLRKQSGVYYAAWSLDPHGLIWYERTLTLLGGMTPTHFGLAANNYTGQVIRVGFPYLRYYDIGTQLKTGGLVNVYA